MKFELDNDEAVEIMNAAIRAMVPVPAGYEIVSIRRNGTYTNATTVELKKTALPEGSADAMNTDAGSVS